MARTKVAPRTEPPKIPLKPGRLSAFEKYSIMTEVELEMARHEIEYAKTSVVLGMPVDLDAILNIASRAIKAAERIDAEAKAINIERNEFATDAGLMIDGIASDLRSEGVERRKIAEDLDGRAADDPVMKARRDQLNAEAEWFEKKANAIDENAPSAENWDNEYDAVRHEK